jgi:phosphotriesterase-related protein
MPKSELAGKVQTVLGTITPDELGITLTHEHCLVDLVVWFIEPTEASQRYVAYQPITLENFGWVRYNPMSHQDNLRLLDEEIAIKELQLYKRAGGNSLVDVTNVGIARDPLALTRLARTTGLNIIMGSGYYAGASHPPDMDSKSEGEITEEIVRDITVGVGNTGVRAGIIGEIGCSWPLTDNELKVLRASARAQQLTGAALTVHPGRSDSAYLETLEILDNAGADLSRVIMDHVDRGIFDHVKRLKIIEDCAKTGCYLAYDGFGHESYFPLGLAPGSGIDRLNDRQRVDDIAKLIDRGYLRQILVSQDCCLKMNLCHYGGGGYAHILNNVLPRMRDHGIPDEAIHTILVENAKPVLTFV